VRVLLVYAHPVEGSFASALRDAAARSLQTAGHDVDLLDLYAEGFVPELSAVERSHHLDPVSTTPRLVPHAERLRRAEALVLVYPTWWGGQPAILKGWFDCVWTGGVAFHLPPGAPRIKPLLRNVRRLFVVTTHGSSKLVNALEGEPGKRIVGRSLRMLCHPRARFRWIALYGMDRAGGDDRAAFVRKVEQRLTRL
jgi:NAD(P)H dehydrogenase (quinone)